MDGNDTTVAAHAAPEPSPVIETLTITMRQDGSINVASDPPMDRWQLLGLFTALQRTV